MNPHAVDTDRGDPCVAVIGGGICGLACAHFLASRGLGVTLYESSDRFGGLGTFFEYEGRTLERFYHVLLPDDDHLLGLLADLGLSNAVHWRNTTLGYMDAGLVFPLNGPLDLLRFRPIPVSTRLRLGAGALFMSLVSRPDPLDDITAEDWLIRLCGRRGFESVLRPLLEAKFGDAYRSLPALWYWSRFTREKGTKKEVKGYVAGGYKAITDALVSSLESRGARLELNAAVERLDVPGNGRPVVTIDGREHSFDRVISTVPITLLRRIVEGSAVQPWLEQIDPGIDYQGVVNVLVVLRRPLSEHYWIAVVRSDAPFDGIVETTDLVDPSGETGDHLIYLMKYVHRSHELFREEPGAVASRYVAALRDLFPNIGLDDVKDSFVFRAPYVEPIYTPGYGRRVPPAQLVPNRVYLATTLQVYPGVTSWNSSVSVARDTTRRVLADLAGNQ